MTPDRDLHSPHLVAHDRVETARVFHWFDVVVFAVLTALELVIAFVFADYWVSRGDATDAVFWIATALIFPTFAMWQLRWLALPAMRRPRPLKPRAGLRVAVVTTFVPSAEPLAMLAETVRALVALEYTHETWVLDEGDDARVRELCSSLGARHFSRRRLQQYQQPSGRFQARTKHGNYNAWLFAEGLERYDVVVTFDPDHVPRRDFLVRTLGYLRDPGVAFVQTPQVYYNQPASFIARGAAEETYAFYSSVQMVSFAAGFPLVVGCHTVHRTIALERIGGLAPYDADDLATTLLYLADGQRGVYVPEALAAGLTPVDWTSYLRQQRRWARSVLDVKFRLLPRLIGALPPPVKVAATLHGLYYLNGLLIPVELAFLCFVLASGHPPVPLGGPVALRLALLWAALAACELYRQRFFLRPRVEIGLLWRAALLRYAKWPHLAAAVADLLRRRPREYELTLKVPRRSRQQLAWAHAATAATIGAAFLVGLARGTAPSPLVGIVAGALVAVSLAISATEHWRFRPPFELDLVRISGWTRGTNEREAIRPQSAR